MKIIEKYDFPDNKTNVSVLAQESVSISAAYGHKRSLQCVHAALQVLAPALRPESRRLRCPTGVLERLHAAQTLSLSSPGKA